jgi:hypothetical protein
MTHDPLVPELAAALRGLLHFVAVPTRGDVGPAWMRRLYTRRIAAVNAAHAALAKVGTTEQHESPAAPTRA